MRWPWRKPQPEQEFGETFEDDFGHKLLFVHSKEDCLGPHCVIHNPSIHSMRGFKLLWRAAGLWDIKPSHFERICPHGIGHPDPDNRNYEDLAVHGCDGCCG